MGAGYIYVLTNPSFPEYVKIGYADDVERRLEQLNRSECLPFAFRLHCTYEVPGRLADKEVHGIIDTLNPRLRAVETFNGKPRAREFFNMSAEEAYGILKSIAVIHGDLDRLKLHAPDAASLADEAAAMAGKKLVPAVPPASPAGLFATVRDRVLAFGGVEVRESEERPWYRSFFAGGGRFLAAVQQRDRVKLFVTMKDRALDDPQGLALPGNRDGERILSVRDEADLESAVPLVRQAYEDSVKEAARDEEARFGDAPPDVRGAWEALKSRVLSLDGAGLFFRRGYPFFAVNGRNFVMAVPQKTALKLYLDIPEGEINDPNGQAVLMKAPVCGVGVYKVFARDATSTEELMPLVRQAFDAAERR